MSDELRDDVSASLRSVMADLADAAPPAPPVEDIFGPYAYVKEVDEMRSKRWVWGATAAAALLLVLGVVSVLSARESSSTDVAADSDPQTTSNPQASLASEETEESSDAGGVDADAGCGLDEIATVAATVDPFGESVVFDITSHPDCSGVAVMVSATPALQGIPIERALMLDDTGAASVADQLFGSRQAEQDWTVELIVTDTGGVAATSSFTVASFCDLEGTVDLQATYLAETNEVSIVLTVDPLCAGTTFTFDRDGIFASSPPGGWETYEVDVTGRIEVTERLVLARLGPSATVIDVFASPAPEQGYLAGHIAQVTLEIDG